MGFGSYDESEQESQVMDHDDAEESVSVHENDYAGEATVDPGASTDDLVDRLDDIRDDADAE